VELVFPEEQAVQLLRAAEEQDVAAGGVTRAGRARGVEPADLLRRVLELAGPDGDPTRANLAAADLF